LAKLGVDKVTDRGRALQSRRRSFFPISRQCGECPLS
jgi:hypothetical protein